MLLWFECKRYLLEYRRILFGIAAATITCLLIYAGVTALLARGQLFEPFSVGLVDNDGTPEIRFVFDFFNDAIAIDYLDKAEAQAKLAAGDIPAYAELPPRFATDIMSGVNTPFYLYRNSDFPLQGALAKLLATGGVAFLSSSQAGIYATLDYAAAHGLSREFINRYILYPINVAFVKRLLGYDAFFNPRVLPLTEGSNTAAQYVLTFITFLFMVSMLSFSRVLHGYNAAVYARFRLAGQPFLKIQLIRLLGVCLVNALWITPLYVLAVYLTGGVGAVAGAIGAGGASSVGGAIGAIGAGAASNVMTGSTLLHGLALAACVGAFGLAASALFKNETACGLFIFTGALVMLFAAGGIVPLVYLPPTVHGLRFASIPYWAASSAPGSTGILLAFTAAFFGVVCVVAFLRIRFPRAV